MLATEKLQQLAGAVADILRKPLSASTLVSSTLEVLHQANQKVCDCCISTAVHLCTFNSSSFQSVDWIDNKSLCTAIQLKCTTQKAVRANPL